MLTGTLEGSFSIEVGGKEIEVGRRHGKDLGKFKASMTAQIKFCIENTSKPWRTFVQEIVLSNRESSLQCRAFIYQREPIVSTGEQSSSANQPEPVITFDEFQMPIGKQSCRRNGTLGSGKWDPVLAPTQLRGDPSAERSP